VNVDVPIGVGSRLAEKSVELTFASQLSKYVGPCFLVWADAEAGSPFRDTRRRPKRASNRTLRRHN
jgi:hypothetical protein